MNENTANAQEPLTEAYVDGVDWANLKPGDITQVPAQGDLPAGRIEVIDPAEYARLEKRVARREGGPAMVVAAHTGSAVGLTARATGRLLGWTVTGSGAVARLGWRYVRATDLAEYIGLPLDESSERKVRARRVERWRFLGIASGVAAALNTAGWSALTYAAGWAPTDALYVVPGAEVAGAVAAVTVYGRYRRQHHVRRGQAIAPQHAAALEAIADGDLDEEDDGEPYPLRYAEGTERIEDCVGRAFAVEGIGVRALELRGQYKWGCEVSITLKGKGSTPGKVNALAGNIDTHLGLPQGGTLVEPNMDESDHITLRLVTSDPFVGMPAPTVHAPGGLSVRDLVGYGFGMDGGPLEFRLRGMSMLVIGSSGSAKTKGALRSLLEAITACRDAVAVEMDPVKDGLTEFADVMAAPPVRGGQACTEWLRYLRDIASARNQVKTRLDMGDLWEPSPETPSIYGVVDEFIYLPQEAKDLAIELLRIGRETGVHLIFAAQEATEDALGDAIASAVTYRIMLASRSEDVRLVFGKGAGDDGYRPDRLRPAVDDVRVYDAGKFYIKGPGFERPILWRWHRIERDQIKQAVADRVEAGRPWFDRDSLAAAGLLHLERLRPGVGLGPEGRSIVADAIEVMGDEGVDRIRAEVLAEGLRLLDGGEYGELSTTSLRRLLRDAGAGSPVPLGRLDGLENPRGYKLESLTHLPR
ncbi:hypothetical protein [Streptomyces sp. NPDC054784]